ncbi:short chain dehydrogenase reductase family [Pelomyxa schiedti]|nr:short chain dehydrogenase reductase family [Pelomyxa schiedti]
MSGSAANKQRVFVVTGSTDGIGRHTALRLSLNAPNTTVVVHGRSARRVAETVAMLRREVARSGIVGVAIDSVVADFSRLADVREMAQTLIQRYDHIDVLINNAGVFELNRKVSSDGYEMTFAVNVLAPFLLTYLLLAPLSRGSEQRVINVSSISQSSSIDFDNLQFDHDYSSYESYGLSKLCNVLLTYFMSTKVHYQVNCLDPGTVNTKMLRAGWGSCGIEIDRADDEYLLATDPSVHVTGKYFVGHCQTTSARVSYDLPTQKLLWSKLEAMVGISWV